MTKHLVSLQCFPGCCRQRCFLLRNSWSFFHRISWSCNTRGVNIMAMHSLRLYLSSFIQTWSLEQGLWNFISEMKCLVFFFTYKFSKRYTLRYQLLSEIGNVLLQLRKILNDSATVLQLRKILNDSATDQSLKTKESLHLERSNPWKSNII